MNQNSDQLVQERFIELEENAKAILKRRELYQVEMYGYGKQHYKIPSPLFRGWVSSARNLLQQVFGTDSSYYRDFNRRSEVYDLVLETRFQECLSIFQAAEADYTKRTKQMSIAQHDTQQVCLNGHQITSGYHDFPQFRRQFCEKCGAETINQCPSCCMDIKGHYRGHLTLSKFESPIPKFCENCGNPYPWTQSKLRVAQELSKDAEGLEDSERLLLMQSLDDIICDTPQTPVAAGRFKRLVTKAGKETAAAFKDILTDVMTETAKKMIFGG